MPLVHGWTQDGTEIVYNWGVLNFADGDFFVSNDVMGNIFVDLLSNESGGYSSGDDSNKYCLTWNGSPFTLTLGEDGISGGGYIGGDSINFFMSYVEVSGEEQWVLEVAVNGAVVGSLGGTSTSQSPSNPLSVLPFSVVLSGSELSPDSVSGLIHGPCGGGGEGGSGESGGGGGGESGGESGGGGGESGGGGGGGSEESSHYGPSECIFWDDFNRDDASDLNTGDTENGGWTYFNIFGGSFLPVTIVSQQAVPVSGFMGAIGEIGTANQFCREVFASVAEIGFIMNYADDANFYYCYYTGFDFRVDVMSGGIATAGVGYYIPVTIVDGDTVQLDHNASTGLFTLSVNGVVQWTDTNTANVTGTKGGMFFLGGGGVIDNFCGGETTT